MRASKPQNNDKAKDRKRKIVDAARELFFREGYKETTITKIASQANYSKRSVYLDFISKDDLFFHICSEGLEILLSGLNNIKNQNDLSYIEHMYALNKIYFKFATEQHEYFRMNLREASPEMLENCSQEVRDRAAELELAVMTAPAICVKKGIEEKAIPPMDPKEAAIIFVSTVSGVLLLSMMGNQTIIPRERIEKLVLSALQCVIDGYQHQAIEYYKTHKI